MSISGGIKFFTRSKALFSDGLVDAAASTGDAAVERILDRNRVTYWRSSGSDDLTVETITITWTTDQTFDRLLLVDHNWKQFTVKYLSGVSYVNFASVVGIGGAQANISETTFADDTAYYEFTEVTTTSVQITVTKTQVADEEKYLNQFIATSELGTLAGYPDIKGLEFTRNERTKKALSGKIISLKSEESMKVVLEFKDYPASLSDDIDLIFNFFDIEQTFLVWLCGGRRGSTYFKKQLKGYRLRDIYSVQTQGAISPDYRGNVYKNPVSFRLALSEAVD